MDNECSELTLQNCWNIWAHSVTQLWTISFQLPFRVILKYSAAFSWTVCSSICWTVCWPLDVVTMLVREHWGWKLEMKKTPWCQNKDCLSPVERLNSNTLSCLESGFQLHAFWTCKKMFTNIWSEIQNQGASWKKWLITTLPNKSLCMWLVTSYNVTLNHFTINLGKWLQVLKKWI